MDALLLAIFNALWQGAALIAIVALALRQAEYLSREMSARNL